MLVLSRKTQEQIIIGDNVKITLLRIDGNKVRIGIDAPREVRVIRGELQTIDLELSDDASESQSQVAESEDAFAHPREQIVANNRIGHETEPQLFVGAVGRNGEKPSITRAPLSRFMTAS